MTQYAIFVHSRPSIFSGKHSGLTLVKYDDNGNIFEIQKLDLSGGDFPYVLGDGRFTNNVYTKLSPFFISVKTGDLRVDQSTTKVDSIGGNDHVRLDVSGDIQEIWDRMVLDAALRSSGNPSNYSLISQVCNTYTVYLAETFLGIGRLELFSNFPDYSFFKYYPGIGEFDQWLFSDDKKGDTIKALFEYIKTEGIDVPSNTFDNWKSLIHWNAAGGVIVPIGDKKYVFFSDHADGRTSSLSVKNEESDVTVLLFGGNDYLKNTGDNVAIDGGEGNDTITNFGDNVTISGGFGKNTISGDSGREMV